MFKPKLECKHCIFLDIIYRLLITIERQSKSLKEIKEHKKEMKNW